MDKLSNGLHFFLIKFFLHFFLITILLNLDFLLPVRKMEVRSRLVELQKTRKRRLPINETSDLSELQQEANSDDDEENSQTNLIKFEQGITQQGITLLPF
ncbi:hypothetical protein ACQ4LE_001354 [Meloidogyne hapla]